MQMKLYKSKPLVVVGLVLVLVLSYIYYSYAEIALREKKPLKPVKPTIERGRILDKNGKTLAENTNFYHFGVSPKSIPEERKAAFITDVAPLLEMTTIEVASIIDSNREKSFTYIKKKIKEKDINELSVLLKAKKYSPFCRLDAIPGRIYPEGELASLLVGYMGDGGKGLSGIEYAQQEILSPSELKQPGATHGNNIYLTIDTELQHELEEISKNTMEETQAQSMMLIASEAKTGKILSYVSLPSIDLNIYTLSDSEQTIDRPAMSAYEPGSVFKIFTAASCLDSGAISSKDVFLCDGIYERVTNAGERYSIGCLEHHGWVSVRDALKYSCNDAFAQIGDGIKTNYFLSYIQKFGFGERTGIELPSETSGHVKSDKDKSWSARSQATMAMGQEISVNALQMVQAASVIANDGVMVKPTVIEKITSKDNEVLYIQSPKIGERVIRKDTARYILSCMETTAQSGTGHRAALGGISIGVKTGTAQMADVINGGYSQTDFLSSCLAIFPVENPEIILYIVIVKAKGETYGGRIAAPVIAKAADKIIDHLAMARMNATSVAHTGNMSVKENAPLMVRDTVPSFIGSPKRDLIPLLENKNIKYIITGEGWVVQQYPEPGTPVTEGMTIELLLQ